MELLFYNWSLPAFLILGGGLMGLFLVIGFAAELPKRGTLEWISMYKKPVFRPWEDRKPNHNVLWALAAFLLQVLPLTLYFLLTTPRDLWPHIQWLNLLSVLLAAGLEGSALFLLTRLITHSAPASLMAAVLPAVNLLRQPLAGLGVLALMLVLYLWFTRPQDSGGFGLLLAACFTLCLCLSLSPYLSPLAAPFVLLILVDSIGRTRNSLASWWLLPLQLLVAAVAVAVGTGLLFVGNQLLNGIPLSAMLSPFQSFVRSLLLPARLLFRPGAILLSVLLWQLPLVIFAAGSCIGLAVGAIRRKCHGALFLLIFLPVLFFIGAVCGIPLFAEAAALGCAYLTGRLLQRNHEVAAILGASVTAALTFLFTFYLYLI